MKYIAFLRGINVGGNNIIKMAELKKICEKIGLKNITTYIQSGNVLFESEGKNTEIITKKLEDTLSKAFNYTSFVIIKTHSQYKEIIKNIPIEWKDHSELRCYVAFIKDSVTENDVLKQIELKEGIDFVKKGPGAIYMTTLLSGLTKSKFSKLISKKIFQQMTIRNFNTTQKILTLFTTLP